MISSHNGLIWCLTIDIQSRSPSIYIVMCPLGQDQEWVLLSMPSECKLFLILLYDEYWKEHVTRTTSYYILVQTPDRPHTPTISNVWWWGYLTQQVSGGTDLEIKWWLWWKQPPLYPFKSVLMQQRMLSFSNICQIVSCSCFNAPMVSLYHSVCVRVC